MTPDDIAKVAFLSPFDEAYWRKMYAGMAMQVVIYNDGHLTTPYKIARSALEYADALIKELRKEKK